jgi:asparagine synthase (glutamine-hydrolysing)
MCGITGIHGGDGRGWIEAMNARLVHRGPDDAGLYRDDGAGLALGMRRLSILDLAGGAQPMRSADGRYVLVYNGELFNAPDLRRSLEAAGERFVTDHSDTEVLLHLLIREGENCLEKLNGMFAFAFYDSVERTLLCARDRMGIKPFYFTRAGGCFAFASELKSLLALPFLPREVDRQALFDYLSLLYVPEEQSILKAVHRLRAGHWLKYALDDRTLEVKRWWRLQYAPDHSVKPGGWAPLIRDELRRAVLRWSLSDVPIAVSLSGGLDSSAIAAIAAGAGLNISAFSLGFEGAGEEAWNELPLARDVARQYGIPHHEVVLRPEATLDALPKMVEALDEPYGGGLPSWFIFREMGGKVKVALTGTGGDELFGSYGKWRPLEGGALTRWMRKRAAAINEPRFRQKFFETFYYCPDAAKRAVLSEGEEPSRDTAAMLYGRFASDPRAALRDSTARLDLETQLPEEFLLMTDRFSMAHSVEARTPFLDNGLVDLVCRIPASVRTRPDDLKYLLREAVAPLLPQSLVNAPKRGFVIPLGMWLRGPLKAAAEDLLAPARLKRQGYFAPVFYDRYVKPHLEGRADHTQRVWAAMMFQLWHERFIGAARVEAGNVFVGA